MSGTWPKWLPVKMNFSDWVDMSFGVRNMKFVQQYLTLTTNTHYQLWKFLEIWRKNQGTPEKAYISLCESLRNNGWRQRAMELRQWDQEGMEIDLTAQYLTLWRNRISWIAYFGLGLLSVCPLTLSDECQKNTVNAEPIQISVLTTLPFFFLIFLFPIDISSISGGFWPVFVRRNVRQQPIPRWWNCRGWWLVEKVMWSHWRVFIVF